MAAYLPTEKRNLYFNGFCFSEKWSGRTLPEQSVSVISRSGRKQTIQTTAGIIRYFSIKKYFFEFGIELQKNGVKVSDCERTYLDLLYYYSKDSRFVFNPLTEVNTRNSIKKI